MRVWITGCAGFLGRRLARRFISLGYRVVGLSRRADPFIGGSVTIDLASEEACDQLRALLRDTGPPDVVVHAAACQPGVHGWTEYVKSNVLSTANLLDVLKNFSPRQLLYTSTLSVYGRPERNPVGETDPIRGNFPYALTKWWGEQIVELFQERSQIIILRLPSMYGTGQDDSFIDGLARLAMRNETIELFDRGKIVRDALHVNDVVEAIVSCLARPPQERFQRMNLGCGEPITAREYVEELLKALKSKSRVVPVENPSPRSFDLYADIERARQCIGFRPTLLSTSMERYASELRSQ